MSRFEATIAALAIGIAISAGGPAAAENVLRFTGMDAWAATMDPHAYALEDNKGATYQVYEALLDVDSNLAIVPQLALAWKPLNPTTWEFELRPDVTLPRRHAVHRRGRGVQHRARARRRRPTFEPMSTASRRSRRSTITPSASRPAAPDPSLWLKLADVAIMSKAWARAARCHETRRLRGAREETYASRHANGTGPFMLEVVRAARRLGHGPQSRLVGHGGVSAQHRPRRSRSQRRRSRERRRPARGRDRSAPGVRRTRRIDQIRGTPGLKLAYRTKLLTMFFGLDQGSAELRSSNIKGQEPVQGQTGAPGDGPRDRHRADPPRPHG